MSAPSNWTEEEKRRLEEAREWFERERRNRFAKSPPEQQETEERLKEKGYTLLRSEPLEEDEESHCTYWRRPNAEEVRVVQVRPDGSTTIYEGEEWHRVVRHLDT